MARFQHLLWGYELSYPDDWMHKTIQDIEGFSPTPEALTSNYQGPRSGTILVRTDWNCAGKPLEALWNRHLGMTAGLIGAKEVGTAAWKLAGASGYETEIVLPKKEDTRLWAGVLAKGFMVLSISVSHPKNERSWFEPIATQVISSLGFPQTLGEFPVTHSGLPLPPGYAEIDPQIAVEDITDVENWQAYDGDASIGALQAFYLREAPAYGWQVQEYVPFPIQSNLGFARLTLQKGESAVTIGLLPKGEQVVNSTSSARVVIKISSQSNPASA
ncbi:MAG: hypothetical protein JXA78_18295 [Anaerolineales bacterium]|nr:hypothetical protein [Anaerolineales bacterium]